MGLPSFSFVFFLALIVFLLWTANREDGIGKSPTNKKLFCNYLGIPIYKILLPLYLILKILLWVGEEVAYFPDFTDEKSEPVILSQSYLALNSGFITS